MNSTTESPGYSDFQKYDYGFYKTGKEEPIEYDRNLHSQKSFSLVIPAYNEEKRIEPFLKHLKLHIPETWEIIIVCDGTDNTADIVRSFGTRFRVLEFSHKLGKGGAIIKGIEVAKGDVIGYVDADGAIQANDIIKVFNCVTEDAPVAIGSRWVRGSKITTKQPISRIILGRLYHYTTFAILGIRHKDTQCGLKAYRKDAILRIMEKLTLTNLSIDTAILYHCKLLKYKVSEVPIKWKDFGGSKFHPVKSAIVMFITLLGLRLAHTTESRLVKQKLAEMQEFFNGI